MRSAPARAELERRAREEAERDRRIEEFMEEQRAIVDGAIQHFQNECRKVAKQGKRTIDCKPDNHHPCGTVYIGNTWTAVLVGKSYAKKRAQDLIPEIEKRLATMGLRSYRVSLIDVNTPYPTHYHIGFRIWASW